MELDLSVMEDLALTPAEELDLKEDQTQGSGLFCYQCGKCVAQCGRDVEIPTLMRSYMYAYGYRNLAAAKETLQSTGLRDGTANVPCTRCDACSVDCGMGFDVKAKIEDIARLRHVPDDFLV